MRKIMTVEVSIDELAHMIAHKCAYCNYEAARCSSRDGCEKGIKEYLTTSDEVRVRLPDLFETPCFELVLEKKDNLDV